MITCQACAFKRLHTEEDWLNHPMAGHGYTQEQGWTHPQAKLDSEAQRKKATENEIHRG